MRRQVRPFTVERKRSGRPLPLAEAPLLDLPPPPIEPVAVKAADAPRWAAAEALFSTPAADAREQASGAAPGPGGRILPSLVETPAPILTPSYDVDDEQPKRRGRKPGSRNKTIRASRGEQGPKTIENVMRNLFQFWAREDDRSDEQATETPAMAQAPGAAKPITLRRRGRLMREALPRAQRWKARLPRFAR